LHYENHSNFPPDSGQHAFLGNILCTVIRQQTTATFWQSGKEGFEQRDTKCGSLQCFGLQKIIKKVTNKYIAKEVVDSRRGDWDDF